MVLKCSGIPLHVGVCGERRGLEFAVRGSKLSHGGDGYFEKSIPRQRFRSQSTRCGQAILQEALVEHTRSSQSTLDPPFVIGPAKATISRKRGLYVSGSSDSAIAKVAEIQGERRLPRKTSSPTDHVSGFQPTISNQEGFLIDLHHVLASRTPPGLSEVIDYHSSRPHLRTLRSYNLVLAYAYRLSDFKAARLLLAQMRLERLHDRRSGYASYSGKDTHDPGIVDAEEEFREVVFQGMWTRGGVGRLRKVAKTRESMAFPPLPPANRSVNSSSMDNLTMPILPISPPERSFQKGSLMDTVYRSVRPHQLRSEANENIKRIMLEGKVDQQLGVGRRHRSRPGIAPGIEPVSRGLPLEGICQAKAAQKGSTRTFAHRQRRPLALLPEPIQPKQKDTTLLHPVVPEAVLPVFAVQALLSSATTEPTAELYLACLKYSLRMSPGRPLQRKLKGEALDKPKAGSHQLRNTCQDGSAKIPNIEEGIRQLLSLEAPASSLPEADKGALRHHHFVQLLHLYLHPHLASQFPPLRTIRDFELALPAQFSPLRPTPRTLTYALAALRYQRARHIRALELVQLFRKRWGDRSVGVVSWKILARYGLARRCLQTITFARNGLQRWHQRMRVHSHGSQAFNRTGDLPTKPTPLASRIYWKLPLSAENSFDWRRLQAKLSSTQRRLARSSKRRISRQTRNCAVRNLIDRSSLLH